MLESMRRILAIFSLSCASFSYLLGLVGLAFFRGIGGGLAITGMDLEVSSCDFFIAHQFDQIGSIPDQKMDMGAHKSDPQDIDRVRRCKVFESIQDDVPPVSKRSSDGLAIGHQESTSNTTIGDEKMSQRPLDPRRRFVSFSW